MFMRVATEALPHSMTKTVEYYTVPSSSMGEPSEIDNHDDRLSASLESKGNAYRRRALSLAETQPSVETVIVKAKRAAQSLWMLLHAQNCVLGQKCPHTGCQEAKLLHLHLKTCPAGVSGDAECPMMYHGCEQSRKLLAHYRRCRSLRARQAGTNTSSSASPASTAHHHCLVCSLVARQARTMLERKTASSISNSSSVAAVSTKEPCAKRTASPRKVSYTVSTEALVGVMARRGSLAKMPPPPPKYGDWSSGAGAVASLDSLARLYETAKQLDGDEEDEPVKYGRDRAVSDAEVFQFKTEQHSLDSSDEPLPILRRERSASCGTVPNSLRKRNSRSQLACETIEEEPDTTKAKLDEMGEFSIDFSR